MTKIKLIYSYDRELEKIQIKKHLFLTIKKEYVTLYYSKNCQHEHRRIQRILLVIERGTREDALPECSR